MLPIAVAAITTILTLAGLGYYLLALWSARAFQHQLRRPLPDFQPGVSILKPVKGLDPEMYASFASHCLQQYQGPYEILFGVSSMADPAVAAIERLKAEFPGRTIRLVLCPELLGANGKVSNLVQMLGMRAVRPHPDQRQRHQGLPALPAPDHGLLPAALSVAAAA